MKSGTVVPEAAPLRTDFAPAWLDREAYPFRSRYLQLPAGRMHYVDEGEGEPLLFVHGTPTWSFEFRRLIKPLSSRYRCIAPDHLGFGLSERPSDFAYTPEAHAAVLEQFVDHLSLDRLTLCVHDFGGPIGLPLALRSPSRVRRLVLLNTWMWPFDDDREMMRKAKVAGGAIGMLLYKYANASLQLIMPSAYASRAKLTPAIHRQYLEVFRDRDARVRVLHTLAKSLIGSRDFYAGLLARAGDLRGLPTLIIWGLKDTAFLPHQLAHWQQLLPAAEVCRVETAGHWPHEEEPAQVLTATEGFLRTHPL
ncbi:MAG: alpha/beta fold hydrolase [Acidobacteriota bacterium]